MTFNILYGKLCTTRHAVCVKPTHGRRCKTNLSFAFFRSVRIKEIVWTNPGCLKFDRLSLQKVYIAPCASKICLLGVSYITAKLYFIFVSACFICSLKQMQYRFAVIYGPPGMRAHYVPTLKIYFLIIGEKIGIYTVFEILRMLITPFQTVFL